MSIPPVPFLTLPTECEGPLVTGYEADSWQEPEAWVTGSVLTHDNAEPPSRSDWWAAHDWASAPKSAPTRRPSRRLAPRVLTLRLMFTTKDCSNPSGVSQSDIKKVKVALPEAVTVDPALAEGLNACSETDLAKETVNSQPGEGCPDESKIGTVRSPNTRVRTTLKGSLFLATPYANPFHSLLGLYVVIKDPETGILIKIPGKVEPNEQQANS